MQVNHEENKIYLINMLASFADQLPTDNELEERLLQFCLHVFFPILPSGWHETW